MGHKTKERKSKERKLKIIGFLMLVEEEDGTKVNTPISEKALRYMMENIRELKGRTIMWNNKENKITIPY